MKKIQLYDTTLRDGEQGKEIDFTIADKMEIVRLLDDFGIDYIEGGWPGSNPKTVAFFKAMKKEKLNHAKLSAFGSTRRANHQCSEDPNLKAILESGAPVAAIFGKSWDLHVNVVLDIPLETNLEMIYDSVKYLKENGLEVIYDAEHFFDGMKDNAEYAMKTLLAAQRGGADVLVLCDTNGGTLPSEIASIINRVSKEVMASLGIHAHNDSDMATANSIAAIEYGAIQVQGTINGFGERCGNANLCCVIPAIQFKMEGYECGSVEKLPNLTRLSRRVFAIANFLPDVAMPYVGEHAFTHKGGIHVSAILKTARSYEHVDPALVGNRQYIVVSELSGVSNLISRARKWNIDLTKDDPRIGEAIKEIKAKEALGYSFEEGEASSDLLLLRALGITADLFDWESFRVVSEQIKNGGKKVNAIINIMCKEGCNVHVSNEGDGPIDALGDAMRQALEKCHPSLATVRIVDYKMRILDIEKGLKSAARVIVQSTDGRDIWKTEGVAYNLIEASWIAILESFEYKVLKDKPEMLYER